MERREASCPVTLWKSSETNTQRNEERGREGREDQPPGGQRRRILNLQNGHKKPAREFASSGNWSLDLKVMLVLSVRTQHFVAGQRRLHCLLFAGREKICFTGFDLIYRAYVCVFSPPLDFSALSRLFFESGTAVCLSQRK